MEMLKIKITNFIYTNYKSEKEPQLLTNNVVTETCPEMKWSSSGQFD